MAVYSSIQPSHEKIDNSQMLTSLNCDHYYLDHSSEVILIYSHLVNKFDREISFKFNVNSGEAILRAIPFNLDQPENFIFIDKG